MCLLTLGACADVKPFDYQASGEIPAGPGLFSGADGAFVILRRAGGNDEGGKDKRD